MDMSPTQGPDMGDPQAAGGSADGVAVSMTGGAGGLDAWERLGAVACSGATRRIELRPAGASTGTVEGPHMGRVG